MMEAQIIVISAALPLSAASAVLLTMTYQLRASDLARAQALASWGFFAIVAGIAFVLYNRAAGHPIGPDVSETVILGIAVLCAAIPSAWVLLAVRRYLRERE